MTFDEVEERIAEAAEIERRLPRLRGERPDVARGVWPEHVYTFADRVGWDEDRHKLDREKRTMVPASVTRAEYDRWQEVRGWIIEYLTDPPERRAVTAWAISAAGGRPFAKWCRNVEHIARQTGYRRVSRAITKIALRLSGVSNQWVGAQGVLHSGPISDIDDGTMGDATPRAWMAPDARPADRPDDRDTGWAERQNARRRKRKGREEEQVS